MRSSGLTVFIALAMLLFFQTSVLAIDIVYPADKTMVSRSDFLIIKGGAGARLEEVTVEINGVASDPLDISSEEYRAAFADFLILEPTWSAGKNTVVVKGLVAGKVAETASAEIFYSGFDDPVAIVPAGFKPFVMHTPENDALCAPCHNMQPSADELKKSLSDNNPCASCHSRMFNQKFVHGPEGIFQCSDCHERQGKGSRWQVTKDELSLCGECHVDKVEEFKKSPYVHGPVATGGCIVCHNPHASDQPFQLNAPTNLLCEGCHSSVRAGDHVVRGVGGKGHPLTERKDPLNPGKTMSCVSCHNPHSAQSKYFFQNDVSNRFALCQLCHKK